jgi:hypothetical protein
METLTSILSGAGGLLLGSLAIGMWYGGGNKIAAIWIGFAGVVCFLLIAAVQMQDYVWKTEFKQPTHSETDIIRLRAYITFPLAAVILNSPSPGNVTAWIRMKNSGLTPAYRFKAWHKFIRGKTGQDPFGETLPFENEAVLGPGQDANSSSTLTLDAAQLDAVKTEVLSLYVWGRIEFVDEFKRDRHISFKGVMNGPPDTILVDGVRAQGWGFRAIKDGWDEN